MADQQKRRQEGVPDPRGDGSARSRRMWDVAVVAGMSVAMILAVMVGQFLVAGVILIGALFVPGWLARRRNERDLGASGPADGQPGPRATPESSPPSPAPENPGRSSSFPRSHAEVHPDHPMRPEHEGYDPEHEGYDPYGSDPFEEPGGLRPFGAPRLGYPDLRHHPAAAAHPAGGAAGGERDADESGADRSERPSVPSKGERPLVPYSGDGPQRAVAQVLFVSTDDDAFLVDCVVLATDADESLLEPGSPVSLRLAKPTTPLLESTLEALLGEWADEGAVVELELSEHRGGTRTRLSQGSTKLYLDLIAG